MATDKLLSTGFRTSEYVKIHNSKYGLTGVVVRNSAHNIDWPDPVNFSTADDVRALADYIRELADDLDKPKRERDKLVSLLSGTVVYYNGNSDAEKIADRLISAGYTRGRTET